VKVSMKAAVKLFVDLGFPTAKKWSSSRLQKKVEGLPDIVDEDTDAGDSQPLLEQILTALDDGDGVDLVAHEDSVDVADVPDKKATKKAPKSAAKAPAKAPAEDNGKAPKKVGVIATIIECLNGATEKKPVDKPTILEGLVKRFPDRKAEGMMSTINIQVPSRLKTDKQIVVSKGEGGYWIE